MNLLLDSHALLWAAYAAPNLSHTAVQSIGDPANKVFWSLASFWELTIKQSAGKLHLPRELDEATQEMSFQLLSIEPRHVRMIRMLPPIHKDPFDRMLIAQAIDEGLVLVTRDSEMRRYPVATLW